MKRNLKYCEFYVHETRTIEKIGETIIRKIELQFLEKSPTCTVILND